MLEAKTLIANAKLPNNPECLEMRESNFRGWLPQIASFLQIYNEQVPWIAGASTTKQNLGTQQLIDFLNQEGNYIDFLAKDGEIIGWVWQYRNLTDLTLENGKHISLKPNQVYASKWFVPKRVRLSKKYKNLPIKWIFWLNNNFFKRGLEGVAYIDHWNKIALKSCLRGGWKIKKWF